MSKHEKFDAAVLKELWALPGGTAYYICNRMRVPRAEVSSAMQRLKRKGKVWADGAYWRPISGQK